MFSSMIKLSEVHMNKQKMFKEEKKIRNNFFWQDKG